LYVFCSPVFLPGRFRHPCCFTLSPPFEQCSA
jgi:hypothetical protein